MVLLHKTESSISSISFLAFKNLKFTKTTGCKCLILELQILVLGS